MKSRFIHTTALAIMMATLAAACRGGFAAKDDVDAPLADMRAWPEDDLELAEEWAIAVHLRASDNRVRIPHKPAFLDAYAPVSAFTRVSGTSP